MESSAVTTVRHTVVLKSRKGYGGRPPAGLFGDVVVRLEPVVRHSILMAFQGKSTSPGRRPEWFQAATDVRFVGVEGEHDTVLHFEAPVLGQAAAPFYAQAPLFTADSLGLDRPSPDDTGFHLMADVLHDVADRNRDSQRFDVPLLKEIGKLGQLLNGAYQAIELPSTRSDQELAVLDENVTAEAQRLQAQTPKPRRVRVVGKLDMIRFSTRSFALKLADGHEVRGLYSGDEMAELRDYLGQRVLVLGEAAYRPSGRLLRIDAEAVGSGEGESDLWSKEPAPLGASVTLEKVRVRQSRRSGASAIFGKWPGDETQAELLESLETLS